MRTSADIEAMLAWLDEALPYAYEQGHMKLLAYLEGVMEEVLFELELLQLAQSQ